MHPTDPIYLATDRLVLRPFTAADVDELYKLNNDPEVMRFLTGGKPVPRETIENETLPQFLACYDKGDGYGFWAAVEKATGAFLGWFEFRPAKDGTPGVVELGYRLNRAAWGKGYATEGARALIRKGFTELGAERVRAETMAVNVRSRRVMEKAGLTHTRTFHLRWDDPLPGTEHGEVEYFLDRADWERRQGVTNS
ncbi:MAG: GNAT family N-acetyltransferase [Mycobacteriales bacterium]